jgi:toxin FitB
MRRDLPGAFLRGPTVGRRYVSRAINSLIARFRCLPFDEFAARSYAQMSERTRRAGHTISMGNAQIAAVAHAKGIEAVAIRDPGPFEAKGLQALNPWTA